MPNVEVWIGDTSDVLEKIQAGPIETQITPNTGLRTLLAKWDVGYFEEPTIYSKKTKAKLSSQGIVRFSKYWNVVSEEILN